MRIEPKLCLTKQQKVVACYCKVTGIASALIVPAIKGYAFEYVHPLSFRCNCEGLIKQGRDYLKELDQEILAGLFLSTYVHFDLLDLRELTATEANAILCTASKESLIEALELASLFTSKNVVGSPTLTMDWHNLKDQTDANRELTTYIRRLAKDFKTPEATAEERKQMRITVINREAIDRRTSTGYIALSSSKVHLSDSEKEFEVSFKEAKKEAKRLINALQTSSVLSAEFISFLKTVNKDRNMVTMSESLRNKVAQKLQDNRHPDAMKLAKIILECANPYDLEITEAPLKAEDIDKQKRIKSLKDILADKRRKSQVIGTTIEAVEDLFDAQNQVEEKEELEEQEEIEEESSEGEALDERLNSFNTPRSFSEDF